MVSLWPVQDLSDISSSDGFSFEKVFVTDLGFSCSEKRKECLGTLALLEIEPES